MPGDAFPFAVGVSSQNNLVALFSQFFKLSNQLPPFRNY
jgi:hypothetical protein